MLGDLHRMSQKSLTSSLKKFEIILYCIYITNNLCKWGLGTRGNHVLQTKNGGGPAYNT